MKMKSYINVMRLTYYIEYIVHV